MKTYNYFYCGVPISKRHFTNNVPYNWELEIEDGTYSWGAYRATETKTHTGKLVEVVYKDDCATIDMSALIRQKSLKQAVKEGSNGRVRCNDFRQSRVVVDSQLTTNLFIMATELSNDAFEAYMKDNWDRVKHAFPTNHRKNIEKLLNTTK